MQTSPGIRDKVVAITGASSGIGEATALLLAERGAKLVLGARGLARLEALAAGIANQGGEVSYASTDVRRRDDVCALVNLACEQYGKLDVLISNAGVMPVSPLDDLRVDDWEQMIDVTSKAFSTASRQRCPSSANRVSGISSTPLRQQGIKLYRTSRFIPRRSSPCAPSRRDCARGWR